MPKYKLDNYRPNGGFGRYNVDIVMVIDATGSMSPLLEMVKSGALKFHSDLSEEMGKKSKFIDKLRVRIIAFRDYVYDKEDAMIATDFYDLPEQSVEFREAFDYIEAKGGGDIPEDGLEALAFAIKSDWAKEGDMRRHIIVLWTDAPAHELGYGKDQPNYPREKMAKDFDELTEWWGFGKDSGLMEYKAKRLLIYAPDDYPWNIIENAWENTVYYPSAAGEGMEDRVYGEILNAICSSI